MTDPSAFVQAQARVAARRQAREAAAQARAAAAREPSRVGAALQRSSLPLAGRLAPLWDAVTSREGTGPAFRVGQVDAELLDDELVDLLRGQVGDGLRHLAGGHLADDWSAEIMLALRAALFKLTVWDHDATYGAALQNLRYTDARSRSDALVPPSRWQKGLHGLVTVVGRYAWTRWEDWLIEREDDPDDHSESSRLSPARVRLLSRLTSTLSTAHAAAATLSFLVFLLNGRYRTLLDRLLRMRLAPPTSQVSREVSFEYLNRQLVWHAFTEFLLFVLPLVGINRWRRWLSRTWRKTREAVAATTSPLTAADPSNDTEATPDGQYAFLPERTCAICYQDQNDAAAASENDVLAAGGGGGVVGSAQTDVTNPYETMPCACVYCFVCLATRLEREEGEGWTCLRCGQHVTQCRPWSGDVLEPPSRAAGAKTVAFSEDVDRPESDSGDEDDASGELVQQSPEPESDGESLEGTS